LHKLRFCRMWLLIVVMAGLATLTPLELLTEYHSYLQTGTASAMTLFQADPHYNLARPHWAYPSEFMLAVNWAPVANYFCFGLKLLNLNGVKAKNLKVIGNVRRLHLVSLVILLFYIFYLNSRTTADGDPGVKKHLTLIKMRYLAPTTASKYC
jgi:hypothetical protein